MSVPTVNGPIADSRKWTIMVWFSGSTALLEGQGLCYYWDYGTADEFDGNRSNRVEVPTILNARYFAGVAARPYAARTGGQMIDINLPGSFCNILSKASTTIGAGILTCEAGGTYAGYFRFSGFEGEGSCVPLQTKNRSTDAGNCFAMLQTGVPSGLAEVVNITTVAGAITCMVGGVTHFPTNILTDADATFTVANGTITGQRKGFHLFGSQSANNIVITYTSAQQNVDANTALATWTTNTDLDEQFVEWIGEDTNGVWVEQLTLGGSIGA